MNKTYNFCRTEKNHKNGDEKEISSAEGDAEEVIDEEDSNEEVKILKLEVGGETNNILDNSAARHKLSIRPKKNYTDSRRKNVTSSNDSISRLIKATERTQKSWTYSDAVEFDKASQCKDDVRCKREAVIKELLETEEEFCKDLVYVVEHYKKPSDGNCVPTVVRDNADIIFSNFQTISNFHNMTLIEGIKYYSNEPRMLGKTFLRLERDFDKHIAYCRDVAIAQEFLTRTPEAMEFFEELSQKLGDGKNILEYLKLPVQRINDYQVLLKDLVKYSDKLGENTNDLRNALELMQAIPQRANDNKFLNNIEGYHGNIHKLGRLLHHDWFTIDSDEGAAKERYLFLFKDHIIVCKVKKISADRSVFSLKELISLSHAKIEDNPDDNSFNIISEGEESDSCIRVVARKGNTKDSWLSEIKKHVPSIFEIPGEGKPGKDLEKHEEISADFADESELSLKRVPEDPGRISSQELFVAAAIDDASDKYIEENKTVATMNRRYSTRRSQKTYEESSYSQSGRSEIYKRSSISSSSQYSHISTSHTYESSSIVGSTRSTSVTGSTALALKDSDKPIFVRTISGLNLEPGDTAVFECQLKSDAQLSWLKDNKALEDKLADRVSRSSTDDNTHRLELQHITEADSGTYTACAQKDDNYATCTAHLVVEKVSDEERRRRKEANAPFFAVRLKDTELIKNTNFTFMVKVKGTPNPAVKFFKDGVPLRSGDDHVTVNDVNAEIGFYELIISDVQSHHAGLYSCKATNSFGEAHCEGTVTVTDEKVVFKGLENDNLLTPGEKPSFTWLKDGKSFNPDERFKVLLGNEDDSLALIFQHVKPDDAGLYTCVASTTAGRISCSAELSVQGVVSPLSREPEKPNISKEMKSTEANVGDSAMLEAKILGFPKPDIKWYHDGEEIKSEGRYKFLYEDQETMTLVIKNVNPNDGGAYKIIAKNELGEDCAELSLVVKGAPKIKKLKNVQVNANEDIVLTTIIEGCPPPEVKWFKDDKELKESDRIKFTRDSSNNHSLIIEKATLKDEGTYSVSAKNEINQCSESCTVEIRAPPALAKNMKKNVDVASGEEIVFEIEVSSDSKPNVKWMKNGEEIVEDESKTKIEVDGDTHRIRILDADASDSAEYSVEVSNEFGVTKDSGKANVTTKTFAPTFKKALQDTMAREGDTGIEFSVEISAYPKPKIKWYLDEMEITEKRNEYTKVEDDNNYKLIVKKVTTELKGTYKCKVENNCGAAETTAKLTVHSKPVFVKVLEPKITVDEGAELTLRIECAGTPEPEISWFKDGQEIHTDAHIKIVKDSHRSESYSMTLTLIKGSDSGDYEARATNCMGSATTKTCVQVFTKITETSREDTEGILKNETLEETQVGALTMDEEEEKPDNLSRLRLPKPKINLMEFGWGGVKVEEIEENTDQKDGLCVTQGIVEEFLETENISECSHDKLHISRGVSIVSLSEDERSLSRNNSENDVSERDVSLHEELLEKDDKTPERSVCEEKNEPEDSANDDFWEMLENDRNSLKPEKNKVPEKDVEQVESTLKRSDSVVDEVTPLPKTEIVTCPKEKIATPQTPRNNVEKSFEPGVPDGPSDEPSATEKNPAKEEKIEKIYKPESETVRDIDEKKPPNEAVDRENKIEDDSPIKPSIGGDRLMTSEPVKANDVTGETVKREPESDTDEDPVVDALLKRIKKQRSVLEDILTKEVEMTHEGGHEKPVFKEVLKDQKTREKNSVSFNCVVTANPEPDITWTHDGKEVKADGSGFITEKNVKEVDKATEYTYTLKILDAKSADAGLYMIKAQNKYGYGESSATLTIQISEDSGQKPVIKNLKDVTTIISGNAVFECEIRSETPVEVIWQDRNGDKIKSDGHFEIIENKAKGIYKLSIRDAKSEDFTEYTLIASNEVGVSRQTAKLSLHGEMPSFVKLLEDANVKNGEDVDFLIRCNGIPKPDVKWWKNENELEGDDRIRVTTQTEGQVSSTLSIGKFGIADEGEYKVTATNVMGTAENKFKLKMSAIPPSFDKGLPKSLEVDEGEVLELKCKVSGSPLPTLKWLKDGEPLLPSENIKIVQQPDGLVKLSVENAKPCDSGTYSLVAENPNGRSVANCAAFVEPKNCRPKFVSGLKDAQGAIGQPVLLEAQIMCYPPPDIKWFKDGRPLKPSQGISSFNPENGKLELAIKSLNPDDAGNYSVKVSNKLGEAVQEAKIEAIEPLQKPKFDSGLSPVSVVEGFPTKFCVKASGNPKPAIKWYRNGEEIVPDAHHYSVKNEPDGSISLLIDKCGFEDAGEYSAVATNDQGETPSKGLLTILSKKEEQKDKQEPSFIGPLNNVAIDEGTDIVLTAPIQGNPIPDVSWEKDGKSLQLSDRFLPTCDGKKVALEIQSCKPSDSGVYTCNLHNSLGEAKSKGKVDVKKIFKEPIFDEKFKDSEELLGKDFKFSARISGNPKPETEWYFNGEPVKNGSKYQMSCVGDRYSLTIRDCKLPDSGLYRCSAFNRAGKAECVAQFNVVQKSEMEQKSEPPSFLKKISDCDIYPGMTAKFTACCSGYPKPDFEWFKGDDKLKRSDRIKMGSEDNGLIRLTISGINEDDVGTYRLRISNPHGEAECSSRLICNKFEHKPKKSLPAKPEQKEKISKGLPNPLTDKPIISRMTDRHLTLSWKPYIPTGPHPPVTYIIEMLKQPDGDWFTVRKGIRSCACDIRNLEPFQDYRFRVRVENKYGISDPSPYAETYRQKIIPDPPKFEPYLSPGIDFRPDTSPYFPKDFDLDRPPHDRYEQAPKFLRQESQVQYGIKNQNSNLFWFVYGYPKPVMSYYFNDEPVEMGGRYECSYTRNGQATLFINKMLDRDVGTYEAVARNEHGEARQRVQLKIAEHPVFIRRPEESYIMLRNSGQLTARIIGVPCPDVKWYKDWQPLAASSRIKIQQTAPDTFVLTINEAIFKDEGLYSVSATNVAGTVSSSAMVHIEENEEMYKYATYGGGLNVKTRSEPFSNYYDIGDELGRGTQGITYHAVERRSGQNFAAKFMHGRSELKPFMLNELNMMNYMNHPKLIRLRDSFETRDLLVLVMELAGGGELLEWLIKQTYVTEIEIASYIRQILWGLEYMHTNGFAHLSLTLNDLLLSRIDGDDIKICDFGLTRKIVHGNLLALNYGMPEFVAPEVANGEGVSYAADLWSLGIITYILLSGFSPFRGVNDRETLTRIKEGKWEFKEDYFSGISSDARDFITKLLMYKPEDRMDVKTALSHPWLQKIGTTPMDQARIDTTNLRNYHSTLRSWYKNANCRTWYRRQPLSNAFTHPSKMVYPPHHEYTPEREEVPVKTTRQVNGRPAADVGIPSREPLDYEVGNFKSESQYQYGPDTYLLQLRDVDLPCRLRHYMKVAADRQHTFSTELPEKHIDWRTPVIRERRKFTDIMDEEIDDEKRARINQYGSEDVYSLRRLKHEIGCRSDGHAEAEAMLEYKREGHLPFFREKPQNLAVVQNKPAEFSCMVVGDPMPTVQWFKNDLVLAETSRIKMLADQNNRFYLKFEKALPTDVGAYKVIARNKIGQTSARMRMVLATVPLSPDPPEATEISDTEVLLKWKHENDDVFTPISCYSLQCKQTDDKDWMDISKNIDHEFWLVENLTPDTNYDFRLSSKNCVGWSAPGLPLLSVRTKEAGAEKVKICNFQRQIQFQTENRDDVKMKEPEMRDYKIEDSPLEWMADSNVEAKYQFKSEIVRGQFSLVVKGVDNSTNQHVVAKIFDVNSDTEKSVAREFDNIKSLRHERIVTLHAALRPAPNVAIFIMEKLQGADILSYFASRKEYNEDMVVTALTQVLDGLQYLHWRGLCHLNIQPDNIVLSSVRALQVKLVDFGSAQKVSKLGTIVNVPQTEYTAPEIISGEPAFPQSDVWSLGIIAYILLSGVSPFRGTTEQETQQNITFVRYRFEHLYKELTQESTRFLMQVFKRSPSKRPSVEECYETRWFLTSEFIIKKRQKESFPGSRLKEFNETYHSEKLGKGVTSDFLRKAFGEKVLTRSTSVQEELISF